MVLSRCCPEMCPVLLRLVFCAWWADQVRQPRTDAGRCPVLVPADGKLLTHGKRLFLRFCVAVAGLMKKWRLCHGELYPGKLLLFKEKGVWCG